MSKIALILGSGGQLGSEFKSIYKEIPDITFYFATRDEIDIEDPELDSLLDFHCPDVVINCAAYTAVDKAEEDSEKAYSINTNALTMLAKATKKCGAILIHISSDYVYHLDKKGPLLETDICSPKGVYAKSKLAGEQIIKETIDEHIILRTSWLYSSFGNNFVKTMIKLGATRNEISIVADQIGAPTYARDLARAVGSIAHQLLFSDAENKPYGTYNYSNEGAISWYDFAQTIFDLKKFKVTLSKTTTKAYNAPAARPNWSVLSKNKIKNTFKLETPHWLDGLRRMLVELDKNGT